MRQAFEVPSEAEVAKLDSNFSIISFLQEDVPRLDKRILDLDLEFRVTLLCRLHNRDSADSASLGYHYSTVPEVHVNMCIGVHTVPDHGWESLQFVIRIPNLRSENRSDLRIGIPYSLTCNLKI